MKRFRYILVFSLFTFVLSAQSKKGNSGTGGAVKTPSTTPDKQIVSEKDLTNHLLKTFSYSDRVESYDISTASKSNPDAVTSLKLRKQGLTEIPSDLSKFKNLVELDLSDNEIGDFSSKLSGLPNLEVLNLSGNNLTTIPADLCELKKLKTINLSSNKITSGSFSCLSGLERIFLNNNELTVIPAGITEMQSLKSLYLHSNKLTDLDEKLIQLKNLEVLLVQYNKIAETQTAFEHTGIINYIFNPQIVNNRYLYKSFNSAGATTYHKEFDEGNENSGATGNLNLLNQSERIENVAYNIKSVDAGNGYRRVKVNDHEYKRYSKFRMSVLFPLGFFVLYISPIHWVISKNHRNNFRLSKMYYAQQKVDRIITSNNNQYQQPKVKVYNSLIVRVYKRYLRSNGLVAN